MTLPYPWHVDYLPKRRRKTFAELRDAFEWLEIFDRINPGMLARAFQWEALR